MVLLLIVILAGCASDLDKDMARSTIRKYFNSQSLSAGAGTTRVDSVHIQKMSKETIGVWKVRARVVGRHSNYSLPTPVEDEIVDYTMECSISQDGDVWKVSAVN